MNTKLLRQKVLDLAIHGKLLDKAVVEALETTPGYEPASKLLERIRGESLPLATAGKPSSASPSAGSNAARNACSNPISEDEIPFEIPENWCWCRLPDISKNIIAGGDKPDIFSKEKNGECFVPIYSNGIENNGLYGYTNEARILEPSITVSARGTIGFSCIRMEPFLPIVRLISITPECLIEIKYIKYVLDTLLIQGEGSSIPQLTVPSIKQFLFPLPPLEEQKLIVEEIERIFALIDTIEQNKTDLETVIKQTKSKILDLAIHGKLVPQDAADEPASKMLEKLRAEKEEKIANGQLKRDKNDSYIYKSANGKWLERKADGSEEEIEVPFEIPESWSWCHASDLYNIRSAIRIHKSDWKDKGIPFFRGRDLVELAKTGDVHPEVFITEELYELNKSKGGIPQKDDILVSAVGTLGCVHIVEGTKKFYYKDAYILCFENIHNLNSEYIKYVIESDYTHNVIYDGSKGTTIDQLTIENAKALWIPFPPLEEQKRIVKNIDEILNMIEIIMI